LVALSDNVVSRLDNQFLSLIRATTLSIRRNTAYNLLGSVIPLAVSLVTIPIYLSLIGEARFGVLAIAWLLLGYFGLFDLGLGRATAQRIAAQVDDTASERAQTFWTAITLNTGLGVIGGLLIWPVAFYFFGNIFEIEDALRPEARAVVPWLILAVPMATLSGVLSGALQGRERFFELSLISIFGTVFFQLFPLTAAILLGADLGVLLPAALFARLLTLIILFERCRRHIFLGHAATFDRQQAGRLLRFGGWVTVSSFLGPMMAILDRLIIGAMFSAKAVTYYAVPFQLGERSTVFSYALATALFPRFAAAAGQEEIRLAHEGQRTLIVVMTPMVAAGVLLMGPFLSWWITPAFAQESTLLGQIILLGFWINGLAKIPHLRLQARGRPDLVAKCYLGEMLPFFCVLYLGLSAFGLVGAAVAFFFRVLLDFVLLASLTGTLRQLLRMLLIPALLLSAAFLIATKIQTFQNDWFVMVTVFVLITMSWTWRQTPLSIRVMVRSKLKSLTGFLARH